MPTSTNVTNLKINELTEAQYDTAVSGGVIGANEISILTDMDEAIQVSTMPTASATELGKVYQFIGTTDANYTHGYFYECVSDGQQPATYSWSNVQVQASSGSLPSQTGNAGKFLTTDGTDASWSDKPLVNTATGTGSLSIGGGVASGNYSLVLSGNWTGAGSSSANQTTNINTDSTQTKSNLLIGRMNNNLPFGCIFLNGSTNRPSSGIAAGEFWVNVSNGLFSSTYKIMSYDGTIPTDRLTKVNSTITLTAAGWSSNTQTVNVTGMTATGVVMVSPDPTDQSAYTSAGIICTAQAAGTLTFTCTSVPSADIDVNVVML